MRNSMMIGKKTKGIGAAALAFLTSYQQDKSWN